MKLRKINCPICNTASFWLLFKTKDFRYSCRGGPKSFDLVKCEKCGVIYVNPRPTRRDIGKFYPKTYYSSALGRLVNWVVEKIMTLYRIIACKSVLKYKKSGKILDIGCGTGDFLYEIKKRGFRTIGIDISPEACRQARQKKLRVFNKELEDCSFPKKSFDVVTLWHVLEHLHDPREVIRKIGKILKDDGLLVIEVPNIKSFSFKLFGKYFFHLDVPRHLFHWSHETLSDLLKLEGFMVVEVSYPRFSSILSLFRSLSRLLEDKKISGLRGKVVKVLAMPFLIVLTLIRLFLPRDQGDIFRVWVKKTKK